MNLGSGAQPRNCLFAAWESKGSETMMRSPTRWAGAVRHGPGAGADIAISAAPRFVEVSLTGRHPKSEAPIDRVLPFAVKNARGDEASCFRCHRTGPVAVTAAASRRRRRSLALSGRTPRDTKRHLACEQMSCRKLRRRPLSRCSITLLLLRRPCSGPQCPTFESERSHAITTRRITPACTADGRRRPPEQVRQSKHDFLVFGQRLRRPTSYLARTMGSAAPGSKGHER